MTKHTDTLAGIANQLPQLTTVLIDVVQQLQRVATAHGDVAREQRITNLIVLAQISDDPAEQAERLTEARTRMDQPRRRSPHEPL